MSDLAACRTALAAALSGISGLRVSADQQSQVNPPMAVIMPQPQQVLRFDTLDGGVSYMLRIVLLVSAVQDTGSQALLDSYLSSTGAASVPLALKLNPTLGGVVDYANMDSIRGYGLIDWAGQQYLGATALVTVAAKLP